MSQEEVNKSALPDNEDRNNARYLKYRAKFIRAELTGTALLLMVGLSIVIFMFGTGSPMADIIPNIKVRQSLTGFLFGSVGMLITLSPIGKISGAHINPVVTMVFWLYKKIEGRLAVTYILSQLTGAIVGCLPLLLWGGMGRSVFFGGTTPGIHYTTAQALTGEIITTFMLVIMLILFIAFRKTRKFTPFMVPVLYAIMVPLEADVSGISTNPARSLGPAIISGVWNSWWIYYIGPLIGALIAAIAGSYLGKRITIAKLYHFDSESEGDALLRRNTR
jgi:aquaporin Z